MAQSKIKMNIFLNISAPVFLIKKQVYQGANADGDLKQDSGRGIDAGKVLKEINAYDDTSVSYAAYINTVINYGFTQRAASSSPVRV